MKNEKLKQHLMAQGAEYLADKIIAIAQYDELLSKELEFIMLKADPKKLAKMPLEKINAVPGISPSRLHLNQWIELFNSQNIY